MLLSKTNKIPQQTISTQWHDTRKWPGRVTKKIKSKGLELLSCKKLTIKLKKTGTAKLDILFFQIIIGFILILVFPMYLSSTQMAVEVPGLPFCLVKRCQKAGQKIPANHYHLAIASHHIVAQIAIWVDPSKMATGKRTPNWKDDWLICYRFWLGKCLLHYC